MGTMRLRVAKYALCVWALALAACVSRSPDSGPARDSHFTGTWVVEQPYHALYEATVYNLEPDGAVNAGPTYTVDGYDDRYVTGSVADPQSGVRCTFAGRWYSIDDATIVIDGNCSDGRYREIVLGFSTTPAQIGTDGEADADVVVLSVAGEDGWVHDDWRWRWRRCDEPGCGLP